MYLHCPPCDLRFRNCRDWYKHLNSEKHQEVSKQSLNNCSSEMSYRSIVCFNFKKAVMDSLTLDEYNIVTYFGSFGLVHDIYYKISGQGGGGGAISACLVLMDSVEVVKAILAEWNYAQKAETHQLKSAIGTLTRRCDMDGSSFQKLMEDAVEEVFQRRHEELVQICSSISLEQQYYEFSCATSLSNNDIEEREGFLKEIETIVQQEFPNCVCKPYGSYLIGVSDRDSDLDVFIDVGVPLKSSDPEMVSESEGSLSLEEVFDRVLKHLRRSNSIQNPVTKRRRRRFKSIIPIPARVPIIRLIHEETSLHCDVSFNSRSSVINSNLMRFYTQYDHRVRPLMAFIRYWGRFHSLLGSNKIKTYALMLMVVVYLNQEEVLPSVIYLQLIAKSPVMVDGWNSAFVDNVDIARKSVADFINRSHDFYERQLSYKDVLQLAKGFFKMFGSFDFESFVVCPLTGSKVDKIIFHNEDKFNFVQFPGSFDKLRKLRHSTSMCVQDPFILDFNVTSNVSNKLVKTFTSLCRETSMCLDKILEENIERDINLFAEVCFNNKEQFVKKPNPKHAPKIQHPVSSNVQEKIKEVHLHEMPLSVSKPENIVQQPNNKKENEATTTKTQRTDASISEFAMDTTIAEYSNLEDKLAEDDFSQNIEIDAADSVVVAPPLHVSRNPFIPETFTYSLMLSVSPEFKKLFLTVLSSLDVPMEVENHMKIAWVSFADDFFRHIFDKGFGLKTITQTKLPYHLIENLNVEEAQSRRELDDCLPYSVVISSDGNTEGYIIQAVLSPPNTSKTTSSSSTSPLSRKRKHSHDNLMGHEVAKLEPTTKGRDIGVRPIQLEDFSVDDVPDDYNFAPRLQIPKTQQTKGSTSHSTNGNEPTLPKVLSTSSISPLTQDAYTKLPTGIRKSFSIQFKIEGTSDTFIGRERRNFKRTLLAQKKPILSVNPINLEESASKCFEGINSLQIVRRMGVNFVCNISVETFEPFVIAHFSEVLNPPAKFPVVHLIRDTGFSHMFHQYVMFRLNKMLSKTGTKNN